MLRVKFERTRRDWYQKTVATLTGIPQSDLSRIETGRIIPTTKELQRLADVFGVPPETLLEQVEVVVLR